MQGLLKRPPSYFLDRLLQIKDLIAGVKAQLVRIRDVSPARVGAVHYTSRKRGNSPFHQPKSRP